MTSSVSGHLGSTHVSPSPCKLGLDAYTANRRSQPEGAGRLRRTHLLSSPVLLRGPRAGVNTRLFFSEMSARKQQVGLSSLLPVPISHISLFHRRVSYVCTTCRGSENTTSHVIFGPLRRPFWWVLFICILARREPRPESPESHSWKEGESAAAAGSLLMKPE